MSEGDFAKPALEKATKLIARYSKIVKIVELMVNGEGGEDDKALKQMLSQIGKADDGLKALQAWIEEITRPPSKKAKKAKA